MAYIEFKDVIKAYGEGDARIHALGGASFTVERGELAIILGASGAGKTTALNILGGMDTRCCSPPESCAGKLARRSPRPTWRSVCSASSESGQICAASSTFSSAVRLGTRL